MAYLKNLIVSGSSRFLNKIYANDLEVSGTTSFAGISASSLTVSGNASVAGTTTLKGTNLTGTLSIVNTTSTNSNAVGLLIGNSGTGKQTRYMIDGIQAWSGTAVAPLYLNYWGGIVHLGSSSNGSSKVQVNNGAITAENITISDKCKFNNVIVSDTLRSYKWDIQHVANLGGDFLVTPTYIATTGITVNVSSITATTEGYNYSIIIEDTTALPSSGTSFAGTTWSANSKIKIGGKINGIDIGTCDGKLTADLASSKLQIQFKYTDNGAGSMSIGNGLSQTGLTVMLLTVGATNKIGIYLTARDDNNYSHISLYGGTSTTPTVRIGNLTGLGTVNGVNIDTFTDKWGIFTSNGFFQGAVVALEGKIGSFTITNAGRLYTNNSTLGQGNPNVYRGDDGISCGTTFKVTNAGVLTAKSGTIGSNATAANNWQIGDKAIYKGTNSITSTTAGTYVGTDGIRNYKDANTFVSISEGVITAKAVSLTGAINATSGTIGSNSTSGNRWQIGSTSIYNGTNSITSTTAGTYIGTDGIRNYKDANTYVSISQGIITAKGVNLTGAIHATSGEFGSATGYHVAVSSSDVGIYSDATTKIASYGASTTIGKTDSKNIYIDSQGLNIRTGSTVLAKYGKETVIGSEQGQCIKLNNGGFAFYDYVEDTNLFSIGGDNVGTPRTKSGTYSTTTLTVSLDGFPKTGTAIKVGSTNAFTAGTSGTYTASSVTYTYDGGNVIKISRATAASNAGYQFSYTADYIAEPVVTIGKTTSDHFVIESGKISANNEYNNPVFSVDINGGENRQDVLLAREDATNKTTTISLADAYANSTSGQNKVIRVAVSLDVSLKSGYHFSSSSGANEVYQNSSGIYRLKWQEYRYGYIELNSSGSSVLNSDIWQTIFPSVLNSSNTAVSITNTLTDNLENITSTSQTNYTITTSLSGTNIIDSVTYTVEVYYAVITTAPSYNCGLRSGTAGAFSSILGNNLYATDDAQVAIGKNNIASKSAFIIGNGSDAYHRSNALTVDWNGNLNITGNITADGFRSIGLLPTSGSPTTANIDTNPAGVIQEIWSSLPYDVATADVRPFAGLVYANGGVCSIYGFRYGSNGEYGAVHYNHYNGNCGDVTVNNNVFTAHNTGKPTTFTFTRNTTNTTELVASRCTIVDHTVCVMARLKVNASTGEKTVGTIPSAYAPPVTVFGSVAIMSGNNSVYPQYCYINSSGGVVLSSTNNLTPNVTLMFTYQI